MKKLYTIAFALSTILASAQVQKIVNGGFEGAWITQEESNFNLPSAPQGNYKLDINAASTSGHSASATTDSPDGTQALSFIAPTSTGHVRLTVNDIPVTPGNTYTISYQYKDETDLGRARHWASFRANNADVFASDTEKNLMQPGDYYPNTTGFEPVSITVTAPANAETLRVSYRVFREGNGGGEIILDNFSVIDNEALGTNDNNIAGLSVYPNPTTGGQLFINSAANEAKDVVIFNIIGKQVAAARVENGSMNIAGLAAGVYVVKITEAGKTATRKLVVN